MFSIDFIFSKKFFLIKYTFIAQSTPGSTTNFPLWDVKRFLLNYIWGAKNSLYAYISRFL